MTDSLIILSGGAARGEFYLHPQTGRTHVRMPAGGIGGGVTSYADAPATDAEHVAFLELQASVKAAEADQLNERHHEAREQLADKREKGDSEGSDVNNPITDQTYGRPPQHVEGLETQKGPRNPADERDPADHQPKSEPVKETI